MRQRHYSSYQFCLDYFQNIMDLDWDGYDWNQRNRAKLILELTDYYRECFKLGRTYKSSEIWNIIKKKHTKWFDELLYDVINNK